MLSELTSIFEVVIFAKGMITPEVQMAFMGELENKI